jgi:hypothetical protein
MESAGVREGGKLAEEKRFGEIAFDVVDHVPEASGRQSLSESPGIHRRAEPSYEQSFQNGLSYDLKVQLLSRVSQFKHLEMGEEEASDAGVCLRPGIQRSQVDRPGAEVRETSLQRGNRR